MRANRREAAALAKLLKVARTKAEEAGRQTAALEAALSKTDEALHLLAASVSSEEEAARAAELVGFTQLAGFLAGAGIKRSALLETRAEILSELQTARPALAEAFAEMKRLEHLIGRSRLAQADQKRKAEGAALDSAGLVRFARARMD
jgi:flagellar export protein FliJ